LMSHFGTTDARLVLKKAEDGDAYAELVIEAMALGVARSIAKLAVVVDGSIDAIILTGGLAHSESFTAKIAKRVSFLSEVTLIPGENEMEALAEGAYRVLLKREQAKEYREPATTEK
jgi:butyrate kinase